MTLDLFDKFVKAFEGKETKKKIISKLETFEESHCHDSALKFSGSFIAVTGVSLKKKTKVINYKSTLYSGEEQIKCYSNESSLNLNEKIMRFLLDY